MNSMCKATTKLLRWLTPFAIALCVVLKVSLVCASESDGKDAEGYQPVNGEMMDRSEAIPAGRLVASAYGFLFVAVLVYVMTLGARSQKLEAELAELQRRLESPSRPNSST